MAHKFHSDTQEKIESVTYSPDIRDSGDLEAGTHTIVPTARPAIGSAQYSDSLTLPKPVDARMVVTRIASRLSVNIAGLGTATHVYCSVRVDVDDADHELFNEDWTSTGAKLDAVNTYSGVKTTIFDLLRDGSAHTFYFLFWADVASQATIDVVQLWEGVGHCGTDAGLPLEISHTGLLNLCSNIYVVGSGTPSQGWYINIFDSPYDIVAHTSGRIYHGQTLVLVKDKILFMINGTVATDLNYLTSVSAMLRREP